MKNFLRLFAVFAVGFVLSTGVLADNLTNGKVHGAVWQFMNGAAKDLQVVGVREIPQQNAAEADLVIKDWKLERPKNDAVTAYAFGPGGGSFLWSGRGTAGLVRYNDGTWVLKSIVIQPSTWNNLNIVVR